MREFLGFNLCLWAWGTFPACRFLNKRKHFFESGCVGVEKEEVYVVQIKTDTISDVLKGELRQPFQTQIALFV